MAYQEVGVKKNKKVSEYLKTAEFEMGESVEGYVTGIGQREHKEDGETRISYTIYMQTIEGQVFGLNVSGNLRWRCADGDIKEGFLTKITRVEDTKTKGKKTSHFKVEQDFDMPLELAGLDSVESNDAGVAEEAPKKIKAATKAEQKRSNLAAKAKMLEQDSEGTTA